MNRHRVASTLRTPHAARRTLASAVALAGVLIACSACGGSASSQSETSSSGPSSSSGAKFASMLPDNVRTDGVIKYASAFNYPPYDFIDDSGANVGAEVDMLDAMEPLLGVTFDEQKITEFSALVPAVGNGRVEMAGESIAVTPERQKQVSYVVYGEIGEGLLVKAGNPSGLSTEDVCGHSVAVEGGAVEESEYKAMSDKCVAAGKEPVDVQVYATEPAQVLAVENGHADAVAVGSSTVASIADKSNGKLEALPGTVDVPGGTLAIGFVFNPNEEQLAQAIEAALNDLLTTGKLDEINKKWGFATKLYVKYLPSTA